MRMDVTEVADVVDDGHAGRGSVLQRKSFLRFPDERQQFRLAAVVVGGQLHKIEFHVGVLEDLLPAIEKSLHLVEVK